MATKITIVGSGASGIHFALTALKKGHHVTMLDVGYTGPAPVNPGHSFKELKCRLNDPVHYFLGKNFEGVVSPDFDKEIYGFPPGKSYIFREPPGFEKDTAGFEPLFSFAAGGLAQAWTGGSYPYNDDDLEKFPFNYAQIEPYYNEITRRIGIVGEEDDLAAYYPLHENLQPPIHFDTHSQLLWDRYHKKRRTLVQKHGIVLGRSRVAVLSQGQDDRNPCDYSGRCLWGCASGSLYVPSITLEQCRRYDNFEYIPNRWVTHFKYGENRRINTLVALEPGTNETIQYPVDTLVLSAGTLSTSKIYLDSIYHRTREVKHLTGLMDNRQQLVPFITPAMLSHRYNPDTYQYHQLAIGFLWGEGQDNNPGDYVHGQVTTLKTALMQPVFQTMPVDWKTATHLGRNLHSAMGVLNLNYSDTRRQENTLSISPVQGLKATPTTLKISYAPPADEKKKMTAVLKKVKKFFKSLGAIIPPGQAHTRPMGASVHYSGTLPMSTQPKPHTISPNCQSHDFENLYIVDGAAFPFLPAKNLTFTLMANAARVAESID
ncbi:MAG: GMC family oxidoreductase [bacterium]|nr:GMC family oxidoreductase [bacterium]